MDRQLRDRIARVLNTDVQTATPLTGGCVGQVYRVELADETVVVKVGDDPSAKLDVEAAMLRYLDDHAGLPVPAVIHDEPQLLVIEYIDHDGRRGPAVQTEAADALAALHEVRATSYGFDDDTLIGGLDLPNDQSDDWPRFFAELRLRDMAGRAVDAGMLDVDTARRVAALADDIEEFIDNPAPPSLLHGDVWGGNVLVDDGHLAAFIDPAIYYGDPEVELAFIGLFNTFGDRFYQRYGEHHPIRDGFFEVRRPIYNLFPLLVHVRLFGGSYVRSVRETLERFGY